MNVLRFLSLLRLCFIVCLCGFSFEFHFSFAVVFCTSSPPYIQGQSNWMTVYLVFTVSAGEENERFCATEKKKKSFCGWISGTFQILRLLSYAVWKTVLETSETAANRQTNKQNKKTEFQAHWCQLKTAGCAMFTPTVRKNNVSHSSCRDPEHFLHYL